VVRNSPTIPKRKLLTILVAGVNVLWATPLVPVYAQRLPRAAQSAAAEAESIRPHWLREAAGDTARDEPHERSRDHDTVLQAFRPVVAIPSKCTVTVWCDDQRVALGTIVDGEGFIATKRSELADKPVCELADGTRYPARLVGADRGSDLALLKIDAGNLPAIRWSDADPPAVGGWVITPGPDQLPLAIGVVSVQQHRVRGGVLGIQMTDDRQGPRITNVVPGSGAATAGLAVGDVFTRVNGKKLANSDELVATTSSMLPGEKLSLVILRGDQQRRVLATLGSWAETVTSRRAQFQDQLGSALSKRRVLFPSVVEHDSVLDPHDCGGVLINLNGKAIGINIARASRISSYAIPASVARPILESLQASASQPATLPVAADMPDAPLTESTIDQ